MHDPTAEGVEFFKCDFCRKPWAEDRPMVEGHQGHLVCARCLTTAYLDVVHLGGGHDLAKSGCTMCLEQRPEQHWASPLFPDARICRRCIKQSATTLEKDPDSGWRRPAPQGPGAIAGGAVAAAAAFAADEDDAGDDDHDLHHDHDGDHDGDDHPQHFDTPASDE
jgi:hypothetical protein